MRRLVIQPGGVVPWHSHADRPAILNFISGEIVEYASGCALPIVPKGGETSLGLHTTSNWRKNRGDGTFNITVGRSFSQSERRRPGHDEGPYL